MNIHYPGLGSLGQNSHLHESKTQSYLFLGHMFPLSFTHQPNCLYDIYFSCHKDIFKFLHLMHGPALTKTNWIPLSCCSLAQRVTLSIPLQTRNPGVLFSNPPCPTIIGSYHFTYKCISHWAARHCVPPQSQLSSPVDNCQSLPNHPHLHGLPLQDLLRSSLMVPPFCWKPFDDV